MKTLKENGLKIVDFPDIECIEINDTRYTYEYFRDLGKEDYNKIDSHKLWDKEPVDKETIDLIKSWQNVKQ